MNISNFDDVLNNIFVPFKKNFVVVRAVMDVAGETTAPWWRQQREKYLFDGVITNQNLREVLLNEIIIEFDHINKNLSHDSELFISSRNETVNWIEEIKKVLISRNIFFYVTDHKGKSPHLRFQISELEDIKEEIRISYKRVLVERLLEEISFKSELVIPDWSVIGSKNKLISIEFQPHWKEEWGGNVEDVVFANNGKNVMSIDYVLMDFVVDSFQKLQHNDVRFRKDERGKISFSKMEDFFKKHYRFGNRNHLILAFGGMCVRENVPKSEAESMLRQVLNSVASDDVVEKRLQEMSYSYLMERDKVAVYCHLQNISKENASQMYHELKELFLVENKDGKIACTTENILTLLLAKKADDASEIMADEFMRNNKIYTMRYAEKDDLWIYKDGVYVSEGKTYIREFCYSILRKGFKNTISNRVEDKIKVCTYINPQDFFVNENLDRIPVNNGILNLKTRTLEPFSNKYFFFSKLPVDFEPDAKCPEIVKFFDSILRNPEDRLTIQEIFGYLLHRDNTFEKGFMFIGTNEGRNGKGKTLELMRRLVGVTNCSSISLQNLREDDFSISELHNKLANVGGDLSHTNIEETGTVKKLIGRDTINAKRKFLPDIQFINYSKLIFSTNSTPLVLDNSDAFFNRWIILDFPFRFLIDEHYEEEKKANPKSDNIKKQDPNIIKSLTTPQEISGLLNWALDGLDRLFKNNRFTISSSEKDIKNQWLRKSGSLHLFIEETLIIDLFDPNAMLSKKDFRQQYAVFCLKNNLKSESDKIIKSVLTKSGVTEKYYGKNGEQEWTWVGIKLKVENKQEELSEIKEQKVLITEERNW